MASSSPLLLIFFVFFTLFIGISNAQLRTNYYYESCGRFRRSEDNGKPYIKCNDCGVRFVEAESSRTLEEWLELMEDNASSQRLLVADSVLAPELTFSPLVFLQVSFLLSIH